MRKLGALFLLMASFCVAKNLDGRVGFGFSYQDFNQAPALSLRYHFSQYVSATFVAGFDTTDTVNATVLGMKLLRNAHIEENLNLYLGIAGYTVADKSGGAFVTQGFEFDGLLGAEFFLSGLPNLGFIFEVGIAVRTVRNVATKTIGGGLASAGIHYYF